MEEVSEQKPKLGHLTEKEIYELIYDSDQNEFDDIASDEKDFDNEPKLESEVDDLETITDDSTDDDIDAIVDDISDDKGAPEVSGDKIQYLSKDKNTLWFTTPHSNNLSNEHHIIRDGMGVTSFAVERINNLKDSFNLCLTEPMKGGIIRFSNLEGKKVCKDSFVEIDGIEFDAYLGILLLIGIYRSHGESVRSLWDETHGRPIFRAVMSLKRFILISKVLVFDNIEDRRSAGRANDKLAPIRDFYEKWTENLKSLYVPNENITVGEQMIPFRGRCPFKVYKPSRPGKYWIKAWVAADSLTGFCLNFQIYLGKTSENAGHNSNIGERVVLDLVSKFCGCNVTAGNFFTSRHLALELLKRKLTLVGTVRNNKPFLPVYAKSKERRKLPVFSSKFFFDGNITVVRYVPQRNKLVTLLSTLHHDAKVLEDHSKMVPDIVKFHNSTKNGVDKLDKLVRTYSCIRQTNRWPVVLFSNFVDLSAVNAYVLWTGIHPTWNNSNMQKRRMFLQQLGESLVRPYIARRERIPRTLASAAIVENVQAEEATGSSSKLPGEIKRKVSERKRCGVCPTKVAKKTFTFCIVCNLPVCPDHRHTNTVTTTYCTKHVP